MTHFVNHSELNELQQEQYALAISRAFPPIISQSPIILKFWPKLERYFPEFQQYMISDKGELIGFMNAIPFYYKGDLSDLPEQGWDWMFTNGIESFECKKSPNFLGGLQVIIRKKFLGLGYSKQIIKHCKHVVQSSTLKTLIIPIRPTKKHTLPNISMSEYINLKEGDKIFDPWIRTHLKGGAEIIKVCEKSMSIGGDIPFWENLFNKKFTQSGTYILEGALRPIRIDISKNFGEYLEPNIWIKYNM